MGDAELIGLSPRTVALLTLVGLVGLSIVKGFLHIDDASTVLISTVTGAVVGFYFGSGREPASPPPSP